jgi:paraquat-inducible protein A
VLARGARFGRESALVFTVTGLILAVPALTLPFMTAGKFGQERGSHLFTSVQSLWEKGMPLLSVWVLLCGAVVPILLLGILAAGLFRIRIKGVVESSEFLTRAARALGYWAIPEVQVLSVLVALMKLGSVVDVTIGPGFWCYAGMSFSLLVAWRTFTLAPPEPGLIPPMPSLPTSASVS